VFTEGVFIRAGTGDNRHNRGVSDVNSNLATLPSGELRTCDECEAHAVRLSFREQRFQYGDGSDAVELRARVPVWECANCGHAYTDGDAEDFRHEAVCRHLGVLSPKQIRAIRERHNMSQAEFARVTGFGLASVKRWETGALIQNLSADRMLRLINNDPTIMGKLLMIETRGMSSDAGPSFRTELPDEARAAAKVFVLRPTGT
jgi:putative zinc finger/helix-turn-helix YgiT family protein